MVRRAYLRSARSSPHYKGSNKNIEPSRTGNKITIKPQALDIVWGNDERYWRLNDRDGPAELLQVCWLEVNGSVNISQLSRGTYKLSFTVSLKPDAFGWNVPVYLMVKPGDGERIWRKATLNQLNQPAGQEFEIPVIKEPADALSFDVPFVAGQNNKILSFGLYEIWNGGWKGGLTIRDVKIVPK